MEFDRIEKDTKEKVKIIMKQMSNDFDFKAFRKVNSRFSEYIKNVFVETDKLIRDF